MLLSQYDRVSVLSIDRRYPSIRSRMEEQFSKRGVHNLDFFINGGGVMLPEGMYDLTEYPPPPAGWPLSVNEWRHTYCFKQIAKKALDDGLESLLFVEDDCVLTHEFDRVFRKACDEMYEHGNIDPDVLYYGANHSWAPTQVVSDHVLKLRGSVCFHCVGFRNRRSIEAAYSTPPVHATDKAFADTYHHQLGCYAIWPSVAVQAPGYSHLCHTQVDYTELFNNKGANQR